MGHTHFFLMLLTFPLAFNQFEEHDLLNRDMAYNEEQLTELKGVAGVLVFVFLRLWLLRGVRIYVLIVLVHGVLVLLRAGRIRGLTAKHAARKVLDQLAAEQVRSFTKGVDSVDGLLSHREPLFCPAWALDCILKLPKERILHVKAKSFVKK